MLKNKKSLAVILSLVMLLAMSCGAWAALTPNADGVYEIGTAEELAEFRDMVNAGSNDINGKLIADVTLPDEPWMPIGTWSTKSGVSVDHTYYGTFDGNGKTIDGLQIRSSKLAVSGSTATRFAGLFGITMYGPTGKTATIQNLLLTNVDIDLSDLSGSPDGQITCGAVVGGQNAGTVRNCGVIGGSIVGTISDGMAVGAVVGYVQGMTQDTNYLGAEISNCFAKDLTTVKHSGLSGGIVGVVHRGAVVSNCYVVNIGSIESGATYAGGIAGYVQNSAGASPQPTKVTNCYAQGIGQIIAGTKYVGGLVGELRGTEDVVLENCVYVASASTTTISGDASHEGGIIGRLYGGVASLSKVENCLYPDNFIFASSNDRPIGNLTNANLETAGREDLLPYDAASADVDLPAIVAAFADYVVTLDVGETYTLDVSTLPGKVGDFACQWSTADPSIASIVGDNLTVTLYGEAVGATTVSAKIRGDINVDLTCMVNVVEGGSSGPESDNYGGGGSSNCSAGFGAAALLSLLGLALVMKRK